MNYRMYLVFKFLMSQIHSYIFEKKLLDFKLFIIIHNSYIDSYNLHNSYNLHDSYGKVNF